MTENFDEEKAKKELSKNYDKAEKLLQDEDKLEKFLQRVEKKLKSIPIAGEKLSGIPIMVSLLNNYLKKDYQNIPIGSIIAIVSALIYFVSPIDLIPDFLPGIGYLDDATVIFACWKLIESDIEEYKIWRNTNNK